MFHVVFKLAIFGRKTSFEILAVIQNNMEHQYATVKAWRKLLLFLHELESDRNKPNMYLCRRDFNYIFETHFERPIESLQEFVIWRNQFGRALSLLTKEEGKKELLKKAVGIKRQHEPEAVVGDSEMMSVLEITIVCDEEELFEQSFLPCEISGENVTKMKKVSAAATTSNVNINVALFIIMSSLFFQVNSDTATTKDSDNGEDESQTRARTQRKLDEA